jgi:excisionase family DNA binding protein
MEHNALPTVASSDTQETTLASLGRLLTVKQAAAAANVHKVTLYRAINAGKLPAFKYGRNVTRVREADVVALLVPHGI